MKFPLVSLFLLVGQVVSPKLALRNIMSLLTTIKASFGVETFLSLFWSKMSLAHLHRFQFWFKQRWVVCNFHECGLKPRRKVCLGIVVFILCFVGGVTTPCSIEPGRRTPLEAVVPLSATLGRFHLYMNSKKNQFIKIFRLVMNSQLIFNFFGLSFRTYQIRQFLPSRYMQP